MNNFPKSMGMPTPGLSLKVAAWMANASALAYEDHVDIEAQLKTMSGFIGCQFFDEQGTQAFLAEFQTCQVLVFRGTQLNEPADILADLNFKKTKRVNSITGQVHAGFYKALSAVSKDITTALNISRKSIYISGHSLGGALAVLMAAKLMNPFLTTCGEVIGVYTFGCPRTGDKIFQDSQNIYIKAPHYRFTNSSDIVPWLPFIIFNYRHTGHHIHLTTTGKILRNPGLCRSLASVIMGLIPGLLRASSWVGRFPYRLFTDHAISNYQIKLVKVIK